MKKWFAYSLLFALTLLLVPRTWVHDCDHDHIEANDSDSDQDSQDNCLVCELDMETGTVVSLPIFNFQRDIISTPVPQKVERHTLPSFDLYDHRGPPASC